MKLKCIDLKIQFHIFQDYKFIFSYGILIFVFPIVLNLEKLNCDKQNEYIFFYANIGKWEGVTFGHKKIPLIPCGIVNLGGLEPPTF